jgi:hypothetical protein
MRLGLSAVVAAAIATASWTSLSADVEVIYPDSSARASTSRLGVSVAPAAVLAAQVDSAPVLGVSATVVQAFAADAKIEASYAVPIAEVEVTVDGADASSEFVELEVESAAGVDLSISTALVSVDAIPAAALLSSVDFSAPFVALVESALLWQIEFDEVVLVTDEFINVRGLSPEDAVVVVEVLGFDVGKTLSDATPPTDALALSTFRPLADDVTALDQMGFGFFLSLGIGESTSVLHGHPLLNAAPLHDNDYQTIAYVHDTQFVLEPGKNLSETLVASEAITKFDIEKALADSVSVADQLSAFQVDQGSIEDVVAVGDNLELSFNYFRDIHDGINSTLNGAPLNQWELHGNDTGETLFASDFVSLEPGKVFSETLVASDAVEKFDVGKVFADSVTILEVSAYQLVRPFAESISVADGLLIGFTYSRTLAEGITSVLNGALLNQWVLNENDTGDVMMPSDSLAIVTAKPLADSTSADDSISLLLLQPTSLNSIALNELVLN